MTTCKFLGINSFAFNSQGKTLLLDPYVSRTPAGASTVCRPEVVRKHITVADYIVLGHSHYDHLGDVQEIAAYTNAIIYGSETTLNICRYFGIAENRLILFEDHKPLSLGPFTVTSIPSLHKPSMRTAGEYTSIPKQIAGSGDYPEGGTWAISIVGEGYSLLNIGSANCIEEELKGIQCDYLLVGIAGRKPDFMPRLLGSLEAKYVIPTHWDLFRFNPVEHAGEKYSTLEFTDEVHGINPEQKVKILKILETMAL